MNLHSTVVRKFRIWKLMMHPQRSWGHWTNCRTTAFNTNRVRYTTEIINNMFVYMKFKKKFRTLHMRPIIRFIWFVFFYVFALLVVCSQLKTSIRVITLNVWNIWNNSRNGPTNVSPFRKWWIILVGEYAFLRQSKAVFESWYLSVDTFDTVSDLCIMPP